MLSWLPPLLRLEPVLLDNRTVIRSVLYTSRRRTFQTLYSQQAQRDIDEINMFNFRSNNLRECSDWSRENISSREQLVVILDMKLSDTADLTCQIINCSSFLPFFDLLRCNCLWKTWINRNTKFPFADIIRLPLKNNRNNFRKETFNSKIFLLFTNSAKPHRQNIPHRWKQFLTSHV